MVESNIKKDKSYESLGRKDYDQADDEGHLSSENCSDCSSSESKEEAENLQENQKCSNKIKWKQINHNNLAEEIKNKTNFYKDWIHNDMYIDHENT